MLPDSKIQKETSADGAEIIYCYSPDAGHTRYFIAAFYMVVLGVFIFMDGDDFVEAFDLVEISFCRYCILTLVRETSNR